MLAVLMACGTPNSAEDPADAASVSADRGDCPQYLTCMADLGQPTNTLEATYGEQGACWTGDPTEDGLCRAACADGLDAAWSADPTPPPGCFASAMPTCEPTDMTAADAYVFDDPVFGFGGAHVMFRADPFDGRYLFLQVNADEDGQYDLVARPDPNDCGDEACAVYGEDCPDGDWLYQSDCTRRYASVGGAANIDFYYESNDYESSGTLKDAYFAKLNRKDEVERTAELLCFKRLEW